MKTLTLAFLFHGDQILLAMKKRKFGEGKWNGYGGKIEEGETPLEGIIREIKEEGDVLVDAQNIEEIGYLDFYFTDKPEWDQRAIIYRIDKFEGEPTETEEMAPRWFNIPDIPYHEMWGGDDQWIPHVIAKRKFSGKITFEDNGEKVIKCEIV